MDGSLGVASISLPVSRGVVDVPGFKDRRSDLEACELLVLIGESFVAALLRGYIYTPGSKHYFLVW